MNAHTRARLMCWVGLLGSCVALPACGSASSGTSTQPTSQNATLTLTLQGASGSEQFMTVDYYISASALTRAAAAAIKPQLLQCQSGTSATQTCTAQVPVGQTVSLFAVEASGGVIEPILEPTAPSAPVGDVEFVSFGGCTTSGSVDYAADCTYSANQAGAFTITATFARMNALLFSAEGAGGLQVSAIQARAQLAIPTIPNSIPPSPVDDFIYGSTPTVQYAAFLPTGSTVTVTASTQGAAAFVGWKGGCSGGGGGCTLTEAQPDSAATTATALFQYWACPNGDADGPGTGCTLVNPSLERLPGGARSLLDAMLALRTNARGR